MKRFLFLTFFIIFKFSFAQEITIIGDSLTVGSEKYLRQQIPDVVIDAKVGRKFQEAMPVIKELESKCLLGKIVVIALGTNGIFTVEEALEVIDYLNTRQRKVIFVNVKVPRYWESQVNQNYQILKQLRPNIEVIDWNYLSTVLCSRPDIGACFRQDGYHLTQIGSYIYSYIIYKYISNTN
ncbi:acyltransferase [Sulfurihydrogenibium subterraneum]|uniref:acyltransferase n=1 Tax=Sulfurihydrogenibium subterraneum TaxID=171121 RepID=UPI000491E4F5|nr:acyltransferase [Sulfurihydrogenibium subterraneum]